MRTLGVPPVRISYEESEGVSFARDLRYSSILLLPPRICARSAGEHRVTSAALVLPETKPSLGLRSARRAV